jgi:hypothetical protein
VVWCRTPDRPCWRGAAALRAAHPRPLRVGRCQSKIHDDLRHQGEHIGLTTVYRTLTDDGQRRPTRPDPHRRWRNRLPTLLNGPPPLPRLPRLRTHRRGRRPHHRAVDRPHRRPTRVQRRSAPSRDLRPVQQLLAPDHSRINAVAGHSAGRTLIVEQGGVSAVAQDRPWLRFDDRIPCQP